MPDKHPHMHAHTHTTWDEYTLGSSELPERDDDEGKEDRRSQEDSYNNGSDGPRPQDACTHTNTN